MAVEKETCAREWAEVKARDEGNSRDAEAGSRDGGEENHGDEVANHGGGVVNRGDAGVKTFSDAKAKARKLATPSGSRQDAEESLMPAVP